MHSHLSAPYLLFMPGIALASCCNKLSGSCSGPQSDMLMIILASRVSGCVGVVALFCQLWPGCSVSLLIHPEMPVVLWFCLSWAQNVKLCVLKIVSTPTLSAKLKCAARRFNDWSQNASWRQVKLLSWQGVLALL